jgi:hypothetical protein
MAFGRGGRTGFTEMDVLETVSSHDAIANRNSRVAHLNRMLNPAIGPLMWVSYKKPPF